MSRAMQQAALENAAYIMDARNRVNGWPKGFIAERMMLTVEMDMYLTRAEAAERKLPTPEETLGEQPDYWKVGETRNVNGSVYPAWTVLDVLDWEPREDDEPAFLYEEVEVHVPARFEVCDTCSGKGSHVNPSIDCMGISNEDFDEDPGFRESYFAGAYDQPCNACSGKRVYPVVDRAAAGPTIVKYLDEQAQDEYDHMAERAAEARMGC